MPNVICFGEILWDNFKEGKKPGGAPLNVALHLNKQHIESIIISSIGNDTNGTELLQFIQDQGLPINLIQQHPKLPTGIVEVELDENLQANYTIVKPVAWDEIQSTEELQLEIENADALVFGSLASRSPISRNALSKILPSAKFKIFDMNLRPPHFEEDVLTSLMNQCDILKINEHELSYLENIFNLQALDSKAKLQHLSDLAKIPTICVTQGDEGATVFHEGEIYSHKGFKVAVADTVGAGDAFLATFIACFLKRTPLKTALERACAAGALVASKPGANPDYSISDIDKLIN